MAKKEKQGWTDYLNIIAEKIASKMDVSSTEWQNLLALTDTFYKCREGYHWAKVKDNHEMKASFYQKMIALQETTFFHKKVLAILAEERDDEKTFKVCLDYMAQNALKIKRSAMQRCTIVLKLMHQDDPRRSKFETYRNRVKSLA